MSDTETDKSGEQPGANASQQPRYYIELIEELLRELEAFFSTRLEDVFKQADDHLFHAADQARNIAEQNRLFESMSAIRVDKTKIQQAFVDELGRYLQPISELDKLPAKKEQKKELSLGLVEEREMDEMVTLTSISSKAASDNAEAISDLKKRLKELSQYNDHIFHAEALEPKRLCDAIHHALSQTDMTDSSRLVVYRFFNEALLKHLSSLYSALNNLLIDHGILPEIDYSSYVPHYSSPESHPPEPQNEMPPQGQGGPPMGQQVQPSSSPYYAPAGGRRSFGSGMPGYQSQNGMPPQGEAGAPMGQQGQPGGSPHHAPAGGSAMGGPAAPRRAFGSGMPGYQAPHQSTSSGMATGPAGQAYSAGVPVGRVRQSIENFVGGSYADVSAEGDDHFYSQRQVMSALTHMQAPAQQDLRQTPLVFDAEQIKKAVLTSIGEAEGGAVTKSVHQVSEKTIDFIKLIFDGIIEEDSITDEIKTLLLSLQIPVIKAAMLDAEFFVDDQHPARQLLDKIAEAGVGVTEHTDPVYIDIEKIVRKLLTDYNEDVVAFSVALEELNALTEEIYRKARMAEMASQKAVKMAHAKNVVLQEIRKVTLGKELPLGVRTLVLKIWPSMMFNHYLKQGKGNDEWVELLMILQKIIESVQPISTLQALEELGLTHQDIIDATRSKLKGCKKKQAVLDQALADLQATYDELMATTDLPADADDAAPVESPAETAAQQAPAEKTPENLSESAPTTAADDAELEIDQAEAQQAPEQEVESELTPEQIARQKVSRLPAGVSPGTWFIVYNGEDKPVRRLKLAVIMMQEAVLVFVDHLGNVVIEKDAETFAEEIEKGLSGVIMQHSVFDHALSHALQSIEH